MRKRKKDVYSLFQKIDTLVLDHPGKGFYIILMNSVVKLINNLI